MQWKVMVTEVCGRLPEARIALVYQTTIRFVFILPNPLRYIAVEEVSVEKIGLLNLASLKTKLNSVALVRERTIPTERPPPVGEVSANFCGKRGVTWLAQRVPTAVNLCFLNLEPLLFLFK